MLFSWYIALFIKYMCIKYSTQWLTRAWCQEHIIHLHVLCALDYKSHLLEGNVESSDFMSKLTMYVNVSNGLLHDIVLLSCPFVGHGFHCTPCLAHIL